MAHKLHKLKWPAKLAKAVTRQLRSGFDIRKKRQELKALTLVPPRKIIVGSSGTRLAGWVSTDQEVLDLLHEKTWADCFSPNSLDAILAEHVWEHLGPEEAVLAARVCFSFLRPGGHLRVAVPDGFHPSPSYIEDVKPGGSLHTAHGHKALYSYVSLRDVFTSAGFDVHLYEYFDENNQFHCENWNPADGMIRRSKRFDPRNSDGSLAYTSIILDAIKPAA